jgi:hypothetical protein
MVRSILLCVPHLPEVRCVPQYADGLHEHVLHHGADVTAAETLSGTTQRLRQHTCTGVAMLLLQKMMEL